MARQLDGAQQCRVGPLRRQAHFGISHARNLVAARGNALRACLDVRAMHGEKILRRILEHMRRPKRPIDARAPVFELGRQPAVDHVNAAQNVLALCQRRFHILMVSLEWRE